MVFAPVRSGNGAKLSSAGLWLNASKSESVLEATMFGPAHVNRVKIELLLENQIRWARLVRVETPGGLVYELQS